VESFRRRQVRIWCVTALVGWLAAPGAAVGEQGLGPPLAPGEVGGGTLLMGIGEVAGFAPAPMLATDVDLAVAGVIVRARVTQRFVNPTDQWLEGIYVFPLPDTAAVDHLRMLVGPRVIEGQIREREEAQRLYQEAKASGRKASLLNEERPNIFTTAVANIGPHELVEVAIEYQDTVPYDGAEFALRFPLVVAPRYQGSDDAMCEGDGLPPLVIASDRAALFAATGTEAGATQEAGTTAGEILDPVHLSVELDPGFPLKWLYSPTHAIASQPIGGMVQLITLADDEVAADRDFVLIWAPATGRAPVATLLAEAGGDELYALLMVMPPDPQAVDYHIAREMVFIIDTSGSMEGPSLEQAKMALLIALDQLRAHDRFNVIQFNSVTEQLFPRSVSADAAHIEQARAWVEGLAATGGTEMQPALAAALADAAAPGEVRQIVFMTDGAVSNEAALFEYIEQHLGESRLFTVGIGSAPNAFFMRKAAQFGRGTFTYVGSPSEVSARMDELFHKLETPLLTDIVVDWRELDGESWPSRVPDLYAGEPLVVAVQLADLPDVVTVSGRVGGEPWRVTIHHPELDHTPGGAGIRQLWARRKIDALMDSAVTGADREAVRDAVVAVALEHHLVSKYTSLVAVDVTPTAPDGATLLTRDLPVNAPHGSTLALPRTATPAALYALLAALCLTLAPLARGYAHSAGAHSPAPSRAPA